MVLPMHGTVISAFLYVTLFNHIKPYKIVLSPFYTIEMKHGEFKNPFNITKLLRLEWDLNPVYSRMNTILPPNILKMYLKHLNTKFA